MHIAMLCVTYSWRLVRATISRFATRALRGEIIISTTDTMYMFDSNLLSALYICH